MESISKSQQENQILSLCETELEKLGFRPVDVDCRVSGRSLIRVFIEPLPKSGETVVEGGVSIDDCTQVSRSLEPLLDEANVLPGAYDLEVSSPGLDRRLRLKADFEAQVGQSVRVFLKTSLEGKGKKPLGILSKVDSSGVWLDEAGKEFFVPFESITQAVRVWQFKI